MLPVPFGFGHLISYIEHNDPDPPSIAALLDQSEREGFRFLRRLIDEWQSGENRFDAAGEVFLVCREHDKTIAVGGLNLDPYAGDPGVARIRHVYVAHEHRRRGIGRMLVARLIDEARGNFQELRLRTNTSAGDAFYRSLGFRQLAEGSQSSHVLKI